MRLLILFMFAPVLAGAPAEKWKLVWSDEFNGTKLDYKGEEDAIFQEVQAGNTTLSLPGTKFVGFRQQHKGLFGIRAMGRLGPLGFTTIASHEKSKGNRRTFRGGARADTVEKLSWEAVGPSCHYRWFVAPPTKHSAEGVKILGTPVSTIASFAGSYFQIGLRRGLLPSIPDIT